MGRGAAQGRATVVGRRTSRDAGYGHHHEDDDSEHGPGDDKEQKPSGRVKSASLVQTARAQPGSGARAKSETGHPIGPVVTSWDARPPSRCVGFHPIAS